MRLYYSVLDSWCCVLFGVLFALLFARMVWFYTIRPLPPAASPAIKAKATIEESRRAYYRRLADQEF